VERRARRLSSKFAISRSFCSQSKTISPIPLERLAHLVASSQSAQRRKESSRTCEKVEYARNNENPHYDLIAMLDDWG